MPSRSVLHLVSFNSLEVNCVGNLTLEYEEALEACVEYIIPLFHRLYGSPDNPRGQRSTPPGLIKVETEVTRVVPKYITSCFTQLQEILLREAF